MNYSIIMISRNIKKTAHPISKGNFGISIMCPNYMQYHIIKYQSIRNIRKSKPSINNKKQNQKRNCQIVLEFPIFKMGHINTQNNPNKNIKNKQYKRKLTFTFRILVPLNCQKSKKQRDNKKHPRS